MNPNRPFNFNDTDVRQINARLRHCFEVYKSFNAVKAFNSFAFVVLNHKNSKSSLQWKTLQRCSDYKTSLNDE